MIWFQSAKKSSVSWTGFWTGKNPKGRGESSAEPTKKSLFFGEFPVPGVEIFPEIGKTGIRNSQRRLRGSLPTIFSIEVEHCLVTS